MDFFPDPADPLMPDDPEELPQPVWSGPPDDVLPGVVPLALVLGRSDSTVVFLSGVRAFPAGVVMTLGVRVRGPLDGTDLHAEVFGNAPRGDLGPDWQVRRLKWGWELSDGRRVTTVDPPVRPERPEQWQDPAWAPDRPVLSPRSGGGGRRSVDHDYWLWPLPPAGPLRVVCQWPRQGIATTTHDLDAGPFLEAAARARPVWPT
jgi:hypothetical protein